MTLAREYRSRWRQSAANCDLLGSKITSLMLQRLLVKRPVRPDRRGSGVRKDTAKVVDLLDKQIKDTVDTELSKKGLTKG